jgi:hypothetical protein
LSRPDSGCVKRFAAAPAEANTGGDEPNSAPLTKRAEIRGFSGIAIPFQRLNAWVKRFIVPEDGFCCLVNFLQQSSPSQRDAGGIQQVSA